MFLFRPHALATACIALCLTPLAFGNADANAPASHSLPEVEVKADAPDDAPGQYALDTERLQRTQAIDLQDIFATDPSVQAGVGSRNGQKMFLRGIEDLNMNVQIDGARQGANLFHHQGRLSVDPLLLKAVRVQAGPAPADAGPGALGGSVRFETVDAQDLLRPGQHRGARLGLQYESADRTLGGSASAYALVGNRLGLLAYARRLNNDLVRVGGGDKNPASDGQRGSYLLKASVLAQEGHSLWLSAERNTNEGGYLRANFPWQTNNATQALDAQEFTRDTLSLRHRYQSPHTALLDLQTTLYGNESSIDLYGDFNNAGNDRAENWLTRSTGGDLHNTARFATGSARHELKTGVDHFQDKGILQDDNLALRLNEKARNTGLYVQDRIVWGNWLVSGGLRVDHYRSDYANGYRSRGTETAPNLSTEWQAWSTARHDITLFAGYGESVRGAKLNQAGWLKKYFLGPDFTRPRPFTLGDNGQLQAERSIQKQWGLRWHGRELWQAGDHAGVELTFFNTRIRDYQIVPGEGSAGVTDRIYNAPDDITSRGFELRSHWSLPTWTLSASYSHSTLRNYNGQPMDTSGESARVGISTGDHFAFDALWQAHPDWQLGYTLTAVQRLKDLPANRPEKPGYATHSLQAIWTPAHYRQQLRIRLGIDNLLDKRYARHTSVRTLQTNTTANAQAGQEYSSLEPGRSLRLGVDWQF